MHAKVLDNTVFENIKSGEHQTAGLIEAAIFWPNQTPDTMRAIDKSLQRLMVARRFKP
jgi:hypothetical protein